MQNEKKVRIGLEIHGYLQTKEKLFCKCPSERDEKPNTSICPICTGYPGSKPMLPNSEAIKRVIQIGLILNCKINTKERIVWQRKHYDWPDLPKGYQDTISGSYSVQIAKEGKFLSIRIREAHLEEDPASWNPETGCIDYNRSGLPLVEIVTEPDFKSAKQVEHWLKKLILSLAYIKAINKKAGIKADVNVSLGKGERVEIKNVNSIENIKRAIEYEITRQKKEIAERETRRFDKKTGKTIKMREKELAEDYRFIPDPDLPVIKIEKRIVEEIRKALPESPQQKLSKLVKKHKIDRKSAEVLARNLEIVEFFESVADKIDPKFALPWITIELLRVLNYNKKSLDEIEIKSEDFVELLEMVKQGEITQLKAKEILNDFVPRSFSIKGGLKREKLGRITDRREIEKICREVIEKNKSALSDYKAGRKEAFNFLIGEVMRLSKRRVDSKIAREIMERLVH